MHTLILGSVFALASSGAAVAGAATMSSGAVAAGTAAITETAVSAGPDKAVFASVALIVAGLIAAALDRIHVDRSQ